jgi:hypothetical protein
VWKIRLPGRADPNHALDDIPDPSGSRFPGFVSVREVIR